MPCFTVCTEPLILLRFARTAVLRLLLINHSAVLGRAELAQARSTWTRWTALTNGVSRNKSACPRLVSYIAKLKASPYVRSRLFCSDLPVRQILGRAELAQARSTWTRWTALTNGVSRNKSACSRLVRNDMWVRSGLEPIRLNLAVV